MSGRYREARVLRFRNVIHEAPGRSVPRSGAYPSAVFFTRQLAKKVATD